MRLKRIFIVLLTISVFGSAGCNGLALLKPAPTPVPPTPTPLPPSVLTICLGYEPESLYPYAAVSQAAQDVLQAIYDGPFEYRDGQLASTILAKLPSYDNGDARVQPVAVKAGDLVANAAGDPVPLQAGTQVFPIGCTQADCIISWDGQSDLMLDQPSATYRLLEGLRWSDGQPLSADDVLFSYELAADPVTPQPKRAVDQTAGYSAPDALTVEWLGIPGLVTDAFEDYFWMPLPRHAWGQLSAAELLASEEANRRPLGWGAYMLDEWRDGEFIRLKKNPHYFRAAEGLPLMDEVVFKITRPFGDTNLSNLRFERGPFELFDLGLGKYEDEIFEHGCDIISSSVDMADQFNVIHILLNYYQDPAIKAFASKPSGTGLLFFNLRENQPSQDSGNITRENPLSDRSLRSTIVECINRQEINEKVFFNLFPMPNDIIKSVQGETPIDQGNTSLQLFNEQSDADISQSDGGFFSLTMLVEEDSSLESAAAIIKENLATCGIDLQIRVVPQELFWQFNGNDSIYQANAHMALIAWPGPVGQPCRIFSSDAIPNSSNQFEGLNFSGYQSTEFDDLCIRYQSSHFQLDRKSILAEMEKLLKQDIPVIPVFQTHDLLVARRDFCDVQIDPGNSSDMTDIESFHYGDECR